MFGHHIKPKAEYPELQYNAKNITTLCFKCHEKEHSR